MNDCSISEGRSGAFFVKTRNRRYIIKFVRKSEYQVLQNILKDLAKHFIHPREEGSFKEDDSSRSLQPSNSQQDFPSLLPQTSHRRSHSNLSSGNNGHRSHYGNNGVSYTPRSTTPIVQMISEDDGMFIFLSSYRFIISL